MAEKRAQRRLAAILAADVVGYSRLMEQDEAGTLTALKARRQDVLAPVVAQHSGRIVKVMGDGVLVEFASAVDAVQCAIELQKGFAEANQGVAEAQRIILRIGINLGDVIVEGQDIYGDGVNVAARLEGLAEPGGIYVSASVHEQVKRKLASDFDELGPQAVKNIAEPVRVFRVGASRTSATSAVPLMSRRASERISIAVLPFDNMSGDPEQAYFSDGITEDIITDLSKVFALNVVSRNTSFAFKGKAVESRSIFSQLNVGYIVEGSVRKVAGRVRITAQLIDSSKDSHVWAERYDRDFNDIFALQDEITQSIVAALKVKLLPAERKAIEERSTTSPEAYQHYLMARQYAGQQSVRNLEAAIRFSQRAVEIDPRFSRAWALTAICRSELEALGSSGEIALAAAEKALALDSTLAEAHAAKATVLAQAGRFEEALVAHELSVRLDPDSFDVHYLYGRTCVLQGRHEQAAQHYLIASGLFDDEFRALNQLSGCYKELGRHEDALSVARMVMLRIERALQRRPDDLVAILHGTMALGFLGEKARAREWAARAMILDPDDTLVQYACACTYAMMGEPDQALDLLEKYGEKSGPGFLTWAKNDIDLASLRALPRFKELIGKAEARHAGALDAPGVSRTV